MILSFEENSGCEGRITRESGETIFWHSCFSRTLNGGESIQTNCGCCFWSVTGENEKSSQSFEHRHRFCLRQCRLTLLDSELGWSSCGWEKPQCFLGRVLDVVGVEFLDVWVAWITWEEISEADLWRTRSVLLQACWNGELRKKIDEGLLFFNWSCAVNWFLGRSHRDRREHVDLAVSEGSTSDHDGKFCGIDSLVLSEESLEVLGENAEIEECQEFLGQRTVWREVVWECERF